MTAGRKPLPTAVKELRGNPGKRPLNSREPRARVKAPTCPKHLGKTARAEWRRVVRELTAMRVLSEIDRAALAGYCVAYGRWVEAEEQVAKLGTVVKTTNGNLIQNPYLSIANRALIDMAKLATEFGMTPSSRSRVKVDAPREKSEFELFLEKKQRLQAERLEPLGQEEAA